MMNFILARFVLKTLQEYLQWKFWSCFAFDEIFSTLEVADWVASLRILFWLCSYNLPLLIIRHILSILLKLASGWAPWRNWTSCSGCSSPSSWTAPSPPKNNGFSIIRTQIFWATEVGGTFPLLEEGYEGALKEYYKKQIGQLNMLISLLLGKLSKGNRQNLMILVSVLKLSVGQTRQSLKGACKYFISRFGGLWNIFNKAFGHSTNIRK